MPLGVAARSSTKYQLSQEIPQPEASRSSVRPESTKRPRTHIDIDIVDLSEPRVDECARLHAECFPTKLETLLGHECIADCLRTRYIHPPGDCFCRVGIRKSDGKLMAYCYAEPLRPDGGWSNAFLSPALAKKHLLRRLWLRPGVWAWVVRRIWNTLAGLDDNEGASLRVPPRGWEVAKMLGVHPQARGSNVSVDMMIDNEEEARRRGMTRVCGLIEASNTKAERLYASLGWVRTSGKRYRVFAMHKDLVESP